MGAGDQCIQHTCTPSPCAPAGLSLFCWSCGKPRHGPGCLFCSIFPVQSEQRRCCLPSGHSPLLTPTLLPGLCPIPNHRGDQHPPVPHPTGCTRAGKAPSCWFLCQNCLAPSQPGSCRGDIWGLWCGFWGALQGSGSEQGSGLDQRAEWGQVCPFSCQTGLNQG